MAGAEGLILMKQSAARAAEKHSPGTNNSLRQFFDKATAFATVTVMLATAGCSHTVLIDRTLIKGQSAEATTQDGKKIKVTLLGTSILVGIGHAGNLRIEEISPDGKVRTEEGSFVSRGWLTLDNDYIVRCDSVEFSVVSSTGQQMKPESARVKLKK